MKRWLRRAALAAGASVIALFSATPSMAQNMWSGIGTGQWYVGVEGGYSQPEADSRVTAGPITGEVDADDGWMAGGTIGRRSAQGWRLELEGAYRENDGLTVGGFGDGDLKQASAFVNLVKEFNNEGFFRPYIGAGAGYTWTKFDGDIGGGEIDGDDDGWGAQGLAGVAFRLSENLDLDIGYRYHWTREPKFDVDGATVEADDLSRNEAVATLRFKWGAPAVQPAQYTPPPPPPPAPPTVVVVPPPAPPPPPPPPPPLCQPSSTNVYFDINSAVVNAAGRQAIETALRDVPSGCQPSFVIIGHTDRTGSPAYNQRLAARRARAVQAVMLGLGVTPEQVRVTSAGETAPAVPTDDGVREPQNRRVEVQIEATPTGGAIGGATSSTSPSTGYGASGSGGATSSGAYGSSLSGAGGTTTSPGAGSLTGGATSSGPYGSSLSGGGATTSPGVGSSGGGTGSSIGAATGTGSRAGSTTGSSGSVQPQSFSPTTTTSPFTTSTGAAAPLAGGAAADTGWGAWGSVGDPDAAGTTGARTESGSTSSVGGTSNSTNQ